MLASSSSGNAAFIRTERTRILVDAGLSKRELFARLAAIDEQCDSVDAILITHEHSDHVSGLVSLARQLNAPIYITRSHRSRHSLGRVYAQARLLSGRDHVHHRRYRHRQLYYPARCHRSGGDSAFARTRHQDRYRHGSRLYLPDSIKFHLRGTDLLVLESNHDIEMLKVGPYPWSVKQRVMGRKGHLSNDAVVSDFIRIDLDSSHQYAGAGALLSEHNNHPEIVRDHGRPRARPF